MTLNASGPLSFGGATTGQSINLELGVSATATASINSTSFRTLAGVASGQISVSNFYGKSNSIGWVAYLGQKNVAGGVIQENFYVDGASNTYWIFDQTDTAFTGLGKLSSDGQLSTYIYPFNTSTTYISTGSTRSSSAFVSVGYQGDGGIPMLYGSSLNRLYPGTLQAQGGNLGFQVRGAAAITSGGELVCAGTENSVRDAIIKYNTNGTSAIQYTNGNTSEYLKVLLRTDGQIILWGRSSGGINGTVFSSSMVPTGTRYNISAFGMGGVGENFSAAIGSSNEIIFGETFAAKVARYDSSYNMTHRINYNSTVFGFATIGIAVYGGFTYINSYSYNNIYVTCLSSSNLSIQWTNRFQWNAGDVQALSFGSNIYATSEGVFFGIMTSGDAGMIVKIPLTGMPSDASVAVSGAGGSLVWTRPSYTVSQQSVSGSSSYSQTPTARTPAAASVPAAGSSRAPTATRTLIV